MRERTVGSNSTPSASKSVISRKNRAGFELPVHFAAVRGPLRRAAARAGPGERGLSESSAAFQVFSLSARFAVPFTRATGTVTLRPACVEWSYFRRHECGDTPGCGRCRGSQPREEPKGRPYMTMPVELPDTLKPLFCQGMEESGLLPALAMTRFV